MAVRLGEHLVYGELWNMDNYSTHGVFVFRGEARGEDVQMYVQLTGNCHTDLRGKHFRFWPEEDGQEPVAFTRKERAALEMGQIGPTGEMTSQGWVRALPCSTEEYLRRCRLGEPPPTKWTRHLYLEWYSQNGRMLVELAGAKVEECTREPENEEDEGDWAEIPNLALPPGCAIGEQGEGPSITVIRHENDGYKVEDWTPDQDHVSEDCGGGGIPDDLQWALDREAANLDRHLRGEGEIHASDDCMELEDCEPGEGEPFSSVLSDLDKLPRTEDLDDKQVETLLKDLLAQMALIGVALDVCPHYTPRDCYRLLRDTIFPEDSIDTKLIGKGFVQHFMTHEFCEACDAELEAMDEKDGPEES